MSRKILHSYGVALEATAKKGFKIKSLKDKVNLQAKTTVFTGGSAFSQQGGVPESLSSSQRNHVEVASLQGCSASIVSENQEPELSGP